MMRPVFTFIVPTLSGGGAERVVSVLASQLADMHYETHIFVFYRTAGEYPVNDKVDVYYDAEEKRHTKTDTLRIIPRLRSKLLSWNTTYAVPFLDLSTIFSFAATRFTGIKLIGTIRNNPALSTSKWEKLCARIMRHTDALFAQTRSQQLFYPKSVQRRSFILPNPVNERMLTAEHEYRSPMRRIVAVGRLIDQKNFPLLVDAMELVAKWYPETVVQIYGTGDQEEQLRRYIAGKGLAGQIMLMGRSNDMVSVLNQSDIFVMTSNYEGMPNALMEAMAVGLPCVSTDCPSGPADLITHGVNGLLVPVNDPEKLTCALKRLLDDPQLARSLGENAKQTMAESYTPECIAKRFVKECLRF